MDAGYEQLKKDGRNGVDNLVEWIKNSKIIDNTAEAEAKVRKMFDDVADKKNIELAKFQEVIGKLGAEMNKTSDQCSKMLSDAMPQLQGALQAAANAFQTAMSSK